MGDLTQTGGVTVRGNIHGRPKPVVDAADLSTAVIVPITPATWRSGVTMTAKSTRASLGATKPVAGMVVCDFGGPSDSPQRVYASWHSTSLTDTVADMLAALNNGKVSAYLDDGGHLVITTVLGSSIDTVDFMLDCDGVPSFLGGTGSVDDVFPMVAGSMGTGHGGGITYAARASDIACKSSGYDISLSDMIDGQLSGIRQTLVLTGNALAQGSATKLVDIGIAAGTSLGVVIYSEDASQETPAQAVANPPYMYVTSAADTVADLHQKVLGVFQVTKDGAGQTYTLSNENFGYFRFHGIAAWTALFGPQVSANNQVPDTWYVAADTDGLRAYVLKLAARLHALDGQ